MPVHDPRLSRAFHVFLAGQEGVDGRDKPAMTSLSPDGALRFHF